MAEFRLEGERLRREIAAVKALCKLSENSMFFVQTQAPIALRQHLTTGHIDSDLASELLNSAHLALEYATNAHERVLRLPDVDAREKYIETSETLIALSNIFIQRTTPTLEPFANSASYGLRA
jgi:hypothetical protein